MRAVAILNPRAGGRKTAYLPEGAEILETRAPGHATELTREALKRGAKTVIAVGGDGTINEVVSGMLEGYPDAAEKLRDIIAKRTNQSTQEIYGVRSMLED